MKNLTERWCTPKNLIIGVIIAIALVTAGTVVNADSGKHSDNIYRQTNVADKGQTVEKTTGKVKQNKEEVSSEKSDTSQTEPEDTGQALEDTGQSTTEMEQLEASEKKEDKKDTVQVIRDTEAYDRPTHIEGYQKVTDIPKGESLTNVKQAGHGYLRGVYKARELYIYYDSTDFDVSNETIIYDKSIQGVTGRAKTELTLREHPGITENPIVEETVVKENTELTILYYAYNRTDSGNFAYWYLVEINSTGANGWVVKERVSIDKGFDNKNPVIAIATNTPESKATEQPMETPVVNTPEPKATEQPMVTPVVNTPDPKVTEQPMETPVVNTPEPKATEKATPRSKEISVTTTEEVLGYEEPDTKAKVICKIPAGTTIKDVKEAATGKGWLSGKVKGEIVFFPYLYTDYVKKTNKKPILKQKYPDGTRGIVTGEGVNLRKAPGITTDIVDCVSEGYDLKLISRVEFFTGEKGWYKARDPKTGEVIFIYGKYVKKVSDSDKKQESNTSQEVRQEKQVVQSSNETVAKKEEVISEDIIQVRDNDNKEVESEKKKTEKKKVTTKKTAKKKEETASKKTSSKASVKEMQAYAKKLCKEGYNWNNKQFQYVVKIVNDESGWNPNCKYNGCIGLFQRNTAAHGTSEKYETDWKEQVKWGLQYIKNRYGTPEKAWQHKCEHNGSY